MWRKMVTHTLTDSLTHSLTHMQHTDPVQYTVLGWVKIIERSFQ